MSPGRKVRTLRSTRFSLMVRIHTVALARCPNAVDKPGNRLNGINILEYASAFVSQFTPSPFGRRAGDEGLAWPGTI